MQLDVDPTAIVQAGLGSSYAQQIVMNEIRDFLSHQEGTPLPAINLDVRIAYNPNITTAAHCIWPEDLPSRGQFRWRAGSVVPRLMDRIDHRITR